MSVRPVKLIFSLFFVISSSTNAVTSLQLIKNYVHPVTQFINRTSYYHRYLWQASMNNSVATRQHPYDMPKNMPEPTTLAHRLVEQLDKKKQQKFLFGASTSEHQCSKQCTPEICSWSRFAQEHGLPQPTDEEYSMDFWHHYKAYIDYAKDHLKLNALRFSIEWAVVQPHGPGSFDQVALDHYADLFIYAIKRGITPLVCFHHYTDPCWFIDRNGFEKTENIDHFVTFCKRVYSHLMTALRDDKQALKALQEVYPRQPLWATFNSPEGYAFRGYREMSSPPADPKKKGLAWVARVLKNVLEAHVRVYYALKNEYEQLNLPQEIKNPQIGFLKNVHQLDPAKKTWLQYCCSPLTRIICYTGDMLQNESVYRFFTTGEFTVHIPFKLNLTHKNSFAIGALDFIGLNYYSNRHLFLTKTVQEQEPERTTDNGNYRIYPQGLYRAIVELSERIAQPLSIPIYVTENGIATMDDEKRYAFYHQYLYALCKAIEDGYPVYGYLPWTLADNYEWPNRKKHSKRVYGLCSVDKNDPAKLIIKNGTRSYIDFVNAFDT